MKWLVVIIIVVYEAVSSTYCIASGGRFISRMNCKGYGRK
jgi:hypothetical protein